MLSTGLISLFSKQAMIIDLRKIKDTHKLKKSKTGILKEDMTFLTYAYMQK